MPNSLSPLSPADNLAKPVANAVADTVSNTAAENTPDTDTASNIAKPTPATPIKRLKKTAKSDTQAEPKSPVTTSQALGNSASNPAGNTGIVPIADLMTSEYKGVSIYAMLMLLLCILILWTGIKTVQQVQAYHQQYTYLQKLKKDYRSLQIENQRLLIEQQTFSATPQIANRAVAELNMFYPQLSDRMIIQANTANANTTAAASPPPITQPNELATPQISNQKVAAIPQGANP